MTDVIARCRKTWRRLGVPNEAAASMAEELTADLASAEHDGVTPMSYVGGDPDGFARAWASARGVVRPHWRVASTTTVALLAVVPAAAMMLLIPLAITSPWFINIVQPNNPTLYCPPQYAGACGDAYLDFPVWLVWLACGLALLAGYAFVLLAVSAWLRRCADPARIATTKLLAVTLPLGVVIDGLISYAFDAAYGRGTVDGHISYTHSWPVVFTLVLVALLAATRWWAVRPQRRQPAVAHEQVDTPTAAYPG